MGVNLQKGQKVNLKKSDGQALSRIRIGLGWDPVEQKKGGLFGSTFGGSAPDIDCDARVIVCKVGRLPGQKDGDDEQILVDLTAVPQDYDKLVFVVNIYDCESRKQDFGMIANAFIRICDERTGEEFCRYNLSESYAGMTAMIFGEIYRYNGEWKFNAIGQGTKDKGLNELARRYQ